MTVRKLIVAALTATCLLGSASTANAAAPLEVAVQDDAVFLSKLYFNRATAFDRVGQFRATRLRVNVLWASVMGKQGRASKRPTTPKFDFTAYDDLLNAARARGIKLQLTLSTPAPKWATGNKRVGPNKPNPKYFKEFVTAVAQHFKGLVDRYSILNEGNHVGWLTPLSTGPKQYRSLFANGYKAIKAVDPNAQVLIGETSPYGTKGRSTPPIAFLRGVLKGGALKADGYAHHPYDFQHKPDYKYPGSTNATLGTIKNLIKELDRQAKAGKLRTPGGKALDVWITEYGYLRAGRFKLSEAKRAAYLRQAYDIALANPRIRQMLQFLLVQPGSKYAFFDMSLVSRSNVVGAAFNGLVGWSNDHAGQLAVNPNSPPPGSGGGGGNTGGGGGGTAPPPNCAPLPVCPP